MARARRNIPSPETILMEFPLSPPRSMGATRVRRAASYRVIRTTQVDPYDEPLTAATVRATIGTRASLKMFRGTSRKAAKLSIASAAREDFTDLKDLIETLPDHDDMVNHRPRIGTGADSNRVDEEKRNIRVTAWLYAASKEDDNDYHLIIGRDPSLSEMYMTVEVSGLPPASRPSRAKLETVQTRYEAFFSSSPLGLPGTSYDFYDPPVPVEIEGSLFFDMSHARGSRPGPADLRPHMPVVWEVHPISKITFEP